MKKYEQAIINRMEKINSKNHTTGLIGKHDLDLDGKHYNAFMCGYMIYAMTDDAPEYEKAECQNGKGMKSYMQMFENADHNRDVMMVCFNPEDVDAKKKQNKKDKKKLPFVMNIAEGEGNRGYNPDLYIAFNPDYMMDFVKFFKTECFYLRKNGYDKDGMYTGPIYFKNEEEGKIGILLPVHVKSENEKKKAKVA